MTEEQRQKRREANKRYREKHADKIKAYFGTEEHKGKKREYDKRYREEHREQRCEYDKRYYKEHKNERNRYILEHLDKIREYNSNYSKRYLEEHRVERNKYYQEHKCEINKRRKRYYCTKTGRASNCYSRYKQLDKNSNIGECTLTPQWIIDNVFSGQTCHWCGETDWKKLGCDRIDNSKPHTPDNVIPSCWNCNNKRGGASYEFFKMMHTPVTVKVWK